MLVCSSVLNDAERADSGCTTGGKAGTVNLGRRIHPERIAASRGRELSGLYAQRKKFVNSEVPKVNYPHLKEGACSPAGLQPFPTRRIVRHGCRPCDRVQRAFTAVA